MKHWNELLRGRRELIKGIAAGALGSTLIPARAQTYPERTVRVIVPFAPGGNVDIVARLMNQKLESALGQSFVAENQPGASGAIGASQVARAKADGYMLLANSSIHVILPAVKRNLNYDVLTDFTPISQVTEVPMVMLISNEHPAKNHAEFLAWAKQQRDLIDHGTFIGSAGHLAAQQWQEETGIKVNAVQYRDGNTRSLDVAANRVPFTYEALLAASPYLRTGKMRPLAVTSRVRSAMAPDVPTFAELGFPGVDASTWHGYWAPAATPKPIIDRLGEVLSQAAKSKDVVEKVEAMGGRVVASLPEAFAQFCRTEKERFGALMKRAGIEPE